jgi:pimeloyl-ACP methyl ester carboxylesterase
MPRRTTARRLAGAALLAGLGAVAWERQRRADARAIAADPETAELQRELPGRSVPVVSADGTRLHAEVFGLDGAPTIVLVHGWTCAIDFWHYQIRDLAGEFRVVAYDQRGHGRSRASRDGEYTAEALADDLQAVIEACVPRGERCLVAGHSMGGMTIVSWAGRHSDQVCRRVAAAALIDTGMGDLARQMLVLRPRWAERIHAVLAPRAVASSLPLPRRTSPISYRATRYVALSPGASPAHVAFTERLFNQCPDATRAGCGRMFPKLDLYASLSDLDVPTTVIVGEEDRLTPPWHARRMAELLPQVVEVLVIPEVGHQAPLEAHEVVTGRLRDLARDHLAARAGASEAESLPA